MNQTTAGWVIFIAAMGMMCSLLAVDIANLNTWAEATKPAFIGILFAHIGAVITAFVGGKLIPPDRDPNAMDRVSDKKLIEINK